MNDEILIDLHAHSPLSVCCVDSAEGIVKSAKEVGLDGVVLCNHFQKAYVEGEDYLGFVRKYLDEYESVRVIGKNYGLKVIFGVEVTMEFNPKVHLLIYGVGEEFLLQNPRLYDLTTRELYEKVNEVGGVLIQAHPYRRGEDNLQDLRFLDGVELSCHPLYDGTHRERLYRLAKENGKILTCGGDYHADTYRPHCGVYFPKDRENTYQIADYLKTTCKIELCVHEIHQPTWERVVYEK